MKEFKDLKFERTYLGIPGTDKKQAIMFFDNGLGVSVIQGYGAYGNKNYPYECACIVKNGRSYALSDYFRQEWGDTVKGYCSEQDVTEIMKAIQMVNPDFV